MANISDKGKRPFNEERIVISTNGAWTIAFPHAKE